MRDATRNIETEWSEILAMLKYIYVYMDRRQAAIEYFIYQNKSASEKRNRHLTNLTKYHVHGRNTGIQWGNNIPDWKPSNLLTLR